MATNWYSAFHEIIRNEIRENEYKLLGEIEVSDEEYKKLLSYTRQFAKYSTNLNEPKADLLVAVTLVQIAIRAYKEGVFWRCFNEEICDEIPSSRQAYLGKVFYKTIKAFRMFELKHEKDGAIQYVENIKAHAFVTNYYFEGFYDFTYAFYENNLFRQLPDTDIELYEDIEALSSFMKTSLSSNENVIESESGVNKAAKSYKLLKSTRNVFAECSPKNVNHIYYPVLKMLDQYYYDGNVDSVKSSRFKTAFLKWCEKENASRKAGDRTRTDRKLRNRKPYLNVDIEKELVQLCIPEQKFRMQDCEEGVYVSIEINDHIQQKKLELWNSFGICIFEPIKIPVPNLFDEINIFFSTEDEKSYRIRHKNYRFFNEHFDMIEKPIQGINYILFKKGETIECSPDIIIDYSKELYHWDYLSVKMNKDTLFSIGKQVFTIIGEYNTTPVFEDEISYYTVETKDGVQQLLTYSHPFFSFDVEKKKLGGSFLIINEKNIPIKSLPAISVCDSPSSSDSYAVNVQLSDIIGNTDGKYVISLDKPGEPTKTICDYILLRDFRPKRKKKYLVFQDTLQLSIKCRTHRLSLQDEEAVKVEEDEESGIVSYEIPVDEYKDYIVFSLQLAGDEKEYILKLPVLMFAYGFSKETLSCKKDEYIWYRDIGENLYINLPGTEKVWVYLNKDKSVMKEGIMIQPGLYQIDISEFRRKILENKRERWNYLNLFFNTIGKYSTALPAILRKMDITPYFSLLYDEEKGVYMNLRIIGKDNVLVTIREHDTGSVLVEKRKLDNGITFFPELTLTGCYDITPIVSEEDEFGLLAVEYEKKTIVATRCYEAGSLVNCRLKISKVNYEGKPLKLSGDFFLEITEKLGEGQYRAEMYSEVLKNGRTLRKKKDKYGEYLINIKQEGEFLSATILNYSVEEEDWMPPYYAVKKQDIIRYDDPELLNSHISSKERYIMLDDTVTEVFIKEKDIRRI